MMKTNKTPSLRVLYDIKSETEYLEEHPELENVYTYHCYKALPYTALFLDRYGDVGLTLCCYGKKRIWKTMRFRNRLSAADKRKSINKKYTYFHYGSHLTAKDTYVHRAIAELFVDCENIYANELDHIDGNIYNNSYDNLEYVTSMENQRRKNCGFYAKRGLPIPEKYQTPENYQIYLQNKKSPIPP